MNPELQALIRLQAVDARAGELREAIGAVPGRIRSERAVLDPFGEVVAEVEKAIEVAKKRQRDAEGEIKTVDQKLRDTRGKQALVKTNEEYRALSHEIENLESKIGGLEDAILEIMESLPPLEQKLGQVRQELDAARRDAEGAVKRLEADQARLQGELDVLLREREGLAGAVSPDWLARYEQLRKGKNGLAVCPIVEKACQGCRMSETLQRFFEIRDSGEISTCSSCGRIIYFQEAGVASALSPADRVE